MTIINMVGGGGESGDITITDFDGYLTLADVACTTTPSATYVNVALSNISTSGYFNPASKITYGSGIVSFGGQRPVFTAYIMHGVPGEKEWMVVTAPNVTSTVTDAHGLDEIFKSACPTGKTFTAILHGYVGNSYKNNIRITSVYQSATTTASGYRSYLGPLVSGFAGSFDVTVTGDSSTCTFPAMPAACTSGVDTYTAAAKPSSLTPLFIITGIEYTVS